MFSLEEQELLKSQTELAEKQAKQKALQQQLQRAKELSESFRQEQETRQQLQKIEADLPHQEEKKKQLVHGRELEKIRPTYDRIQELVKQQIQQTDEATENRQRAAELEQQYSECQKQTTDFEQQSAEWQTKEQQLQSLNALLPLVKQKDETAGALIRNYSTNKGSRRKNQTAGDQTKYGKNVAGSSL